MYFKFFAPVLAFIASVTAIQVLSPASNATWDLASKKNAIIWNSAATDPLTFAIELVNMNVHPPFLLRIARGVKTSAGSYVLDLIRGVPDGKAYQFNFISDDPARQGILAQSQQFNVHNAHAAGGPSPSHTTSASKSQNTKIHSTGGFHSNSTSSAKNRSSTATKSSASGTRRAGSGSLSGLASPTNSPKTTSNSGSTTQAYGGIGGLLVAAFALLA